MPGAKRKQYLVIGDEGVAQSSFYKIKKSRVSKTDVEVKSN